MSPLKDVYFYHKHLLENNLEIFCCPETFVRCELINCMLSSCIVLQECGCSCEFFFVMLVCTFLIKLKHFFKASSAFLYIFHLNTLFVYIWIVLNRESTNLNIRLCFKVICLVSYLAQRLCIHQVMSFYLISLIVQPLLQISFL